MVNIKNMVDKILKIHLLDLKVKSISQTIEQKNKKIEYTRENLIKHDTQP